MMGRLVLVCGRDERADCLWLADIHPRAIRRGLVLTEGKQWMLGTVLNQIQTLQKLLFLYSSTIRSSG